KIIWRVTEVAVRGEVVKGAGVVHQGLNAFVLKEVLQLIAFLCADGIDVECMRCPGSLAGEGDFWYTLQEGMIRFRIGAAFGIPGGKVRQFNQEHGRL